MAEMVSPVEHSKTPIIDNKEWLPLFFAIFIALMVDGMDLQLLNLCLPVLKSEFAINQIQAGALSTYTVLGMALGGVIAGQLSDRIGRVKVTKIALVTFAGFTAMLAFTQNYWQFVVVRFLSGFGLAALYSVGTLLVAEYVPDNKRAMILGTLQAGYSVGYICAALTSAAILPKYGWKPLFILAVIPAAISYLMLHKVKEPASYIEAKKNMKKIRKTNEYVLIWRNRTVRLIFLLWMVTNTALQFGYFGANTWLPSYLTTDLGMDLKNMSLYIAGTYAAMVFGKILAGFLADWFGRKSIWVMGGLSTAIAMPLVVAFANTNNVIYLMVVFGFLYATPYALLSAYMSESFPKEVRGTCVSTTYAVGRVGAMLSPLFVGFMAVNYSIGLGISILGGAYVICALIPGLFIKEKVYDPSKVERAA